MARETTDGGSRKAPAKGAVRTTRKSKQKEQAEAAVPMTDEEILATVCGYFCEEGLTAVQIVERLKKDHGVEIKREKPYEYLRTAAIRGWIQFVPPQEHSLQQHLKNSHPWLHDAAVVNTARTEDVAYSGAKMLLELLQRHYVNEEVHIGFSGGMALHMLAQRFARLLREPVQHLPSKIVFHALVAGFDVSDPVTDPNAFFTYFVGDPAMPFETSFVALHAPAVVETQFESELLRLPAIKQAYDEAKKIDIVVTSTSGWADKHSMLRHCMAVAGASVKELEQAGCIGDMLWQPISKEGPFKSNSKIQAMTIMKLEQLSELIAQKKRVLLVAGPCHRCHAPKTEVVRAILGQQDRLITHLVTDSRCAREVL